MVAVVSEKIYVINDLDVLCYIDIGHKNAIISLSKVFLLTASHFLVGTSINIFLYTLSQEDGII